MHFKHLIALATLVAATAVSAAPHHGAQTYAVVEAGASNVSDVDSEANKASYGVTFGAEINPNFALETSYKNFGSRYDTKLDAFTFSAIGQFPVSRSVSLFGKAGVAHTSVSADTGYNGTIASLSKTGLVVGAGAEFRLNRDWSVRALVETYPEFAGSSSDLTNVSVGVKYRF